MSTESDDIEQVPSRKPTEEEEYYLKFAYEEPVESLKRLEEVAKFFIGATGTVSGLFLAALKVGGDKTIESFWGYAPFACWSLSLLCLVFVLSPQSYAAGKNEPASWKRAVLQARSWKFNSLVIGTIFFIFGIFSGAVIFL